MNQTIAVARAGQHIFHAGTVGPDGIFLKELLKKSGADTRFVREKDTVTGHALRLAAAASAITVSRPGAAVFIPWRTEAEAVAESV